MSWGGFGHGLLGALGKIGGGLKHGLLDVGTDDNPVFKKDPTREALLQLLRGNPGGPVPNDPGRGQQKPLPPWQGPEMPPAIKFQRADDAFMAKQGAPSASAQAEEPDYGYGNRYNSTAKKGLGFLGPLQRPDGGVMSEYSIGVNLGGKETEIPSFVPTLTKEEVAHLLQMQDGDKMPDSVVRKAVEHAKQRIAAGKDPFAATGEQQELYPELPRLQPTRRGQPMQTPIETPPPLDDDTLIARDL